MKGVKLLSPTSGNPSDVSKYEIFPDIRYKTFGVLWENREFANSIWPTADPDVLLDFSIEGKHLKWTEAAKKDNYRNANVTRWMDGFKSGGEIFRLVHSHWSYINTLMRSHWSRASLHGKALL